MAGGFPNAQVAGEANEANGWCKRLAEPMRLVVGEVSG